jgi:hypothetical protein
VNIALANLLEVVQPQVFDVMEGLPINPFESLLIPGPGINTSCGMMFRLQNTLNTVFSVRIYQLGKLREPLRNVKFDVVSIARTCQKIRSSELFDMLEAVLDSWSADRGGQIKNLQCDSTVIQVRYFCSGKASFKFR